MTSDPEAVKMPLLELGYWEMTPNAEPQTGAQVNWEFIKLQTRPSR